MKKIMLSILTLGFTSFVGAQEFNQLTAIGHQKKIEWKTSSWGSGFGHRIQSFDPGGKTLLNIDARHNSTNWSTLMTFTSNGRIGIGTTNPTGKLDIFGNNPTSTNLILAANYSNKYRWRLNTTDRGNAIDLDFTSSDFYDTQESVLKLSRSSSGRPEFQLYNNAIVANNGNVGIGTNKTSSAKLTVAGNIHTREVKVTIDAGADFVFAEDYLLPDLEFIENFVKENKHLPEILSEKEMQEKGLHLAEMNIKLLQKVEELTLYTIAQQKEINALYSRLQKLESKQ